jgi:hypothetical protein
MGTLSFKVLGENAFLVEFMEVGDKRWILEGRQSSKGIFFFFFFIEDFDGRSSPANFTFDKVAFWVQMVNLLLRIEMYGPRDETYAWRFCRGSQGCRYEQVWCWLG